MVNRAQKLCKNSNLILFGARGTGKTSLIRQLFGNTNSLWIDLLSDEDEERFGKTPDALSVHLKSKTYEYVIIDEIQKFPKLLDIVSRRPDERGNNQLFQYQQGCRHFRPDGQKFFPDP